MIRDILVQVIQTRRQFIGSHQSQSTRKMRTKRRKDITVKIISRAKSRNESHFRFRVELLHSQRNESYIAIVHFQECMATLNTLRATAFLLTSLKRSTNLFYILINFLDINMLWYGY